MSYLSLRAKITLCVFCLNLFFCLSMMVFNETFISGRLQHIVEGKGVALAKRVARECISPIITEDIFEVTMLLKDVLYSEQDILYAFVLNEENQPIAHTFDKGVSQELILASGMASGRSFQLKHLKTDKGRAVDVAVPLLQGNIGVFHLGISKEMILKDTRAIEHMILLFTCVVLACGSLVAIWLARTITTPLLALAEATKAYGQGVEVLPSFPHAKNEVGELSRLFEEMVARRRLAREEREQLICELREAMGKIKTLKGLLPICASCKKIRDDNGYWNQIELYIKEHSDAEFSHGICPDCIKKLYPDLVEPDKEAADQD